MNSKSQEGDPQDPPCLLVVDDHQGTRRLVRRAIARFLGVPAVEAASNEEALRWFGERKVVGMVQDFQRDGETALDLSRELKQRSISVPSILYTGTSLSDVEARSAAEREGSFTCFHAMVEKQNTALLAEVLRSIFADEVGRYHHAEKGVPSYRFRRLVWLLRRSLLSLQFDGMDLPETGILFRLSVGSYHSEICRQIDRCLQSFERNLDGEGGGGDRAVRVLTFSTNQKARQFEAYWEEAWALAKVDVALLSGISPHEAALFDIGAKISGESLVDGRFEVIISCPDGGLTPPWELFEDYLIDFGFTEKPVGQRGGLLGTNADQGSVLDSLQDLLSYGEGCVRMTLPFADKEQGSAFIESFDVKRECFWRGPLNWF